MTYQKYMTRSAPLSGVMGTLLFSALLFVCVFMGGTTALAQPVTQSFASVPSIITEGDTGAIRFRASNAGIRVTCRIINLGGGPLYGVGTSATSLTPGFTVSHFYNATYAQFALGDAPNPPGVVMEGEVRVNPTNDTTYQISCWGAGGGYGSSQTTTVRVEGRVRIGHDIHATVNEGLTSTLGVYCRVGGSFGPYCCRSGGAFFSTKSISGCTLSYSGTGPFTFDASGNIIGPGSWSIHP